MNENTDTAIVTTKPEQPIERISASLYKDESIKRFASMLGEKQAQRFVASVLTAVMADPKLQACTPLSVYLSAVRAATLGLSVDPAYGQAYLVAYGNVCTFMPGYKGFRDKASDNGIACHVDEIYDNEEVLTNRMTGEIRINGEHGFWRPASKDLTSDGNGHEIAGYLACWWDVKNAGEKQYLYMTVEQIEEYAGEYSPSYKSQSSPWNKNKLTRKEMMKKTVLKTLLRKTAPLNPVVSRLLMDIEDEQSEERNAAFDGIDIKGTEEPRERLSVGQNLHDLGFEANAEPVIIESTTPAPMKQTPPPPLMWTAERKQYLVEAKLAGNDFAAKAMLGLSNLPLDAGKKEIVAWGKLYRKYRPDPKAKDAMSAIDAANAANDEFAK